MGNIGSAFSAIIFPFFIAHVTIPFFVSSEGTANSFFVFAALMNLLAIFAWIYIDPARKIKEISQKQARYRIIIFLSVIFLIALAILMFKYFN
jgi:ACS family glucarate transporter-like MFS transporter